MIEKLKKAKKRLCEVEELLSDPKIFSRRDEARELINEKKMLAPVIAVFDRYLQAEEEIKSTTELIVSETDRELRAMAEDELRELKEKSEALMNEIKALLIPKDPDDDRSVVVEIRAGTGGDEAALFAADLYRMYQMYAASHGFVIEPVSSNETELGGFKEVVFTVEGKGAFSRFKYESGVHRVQRVPQTESQGRIQTSAVTVAVLPEAEDIEIEIRAEDIKMESCKSSGAGGQHINKTESAVRITHLPSGIVVECQEERSQFKNRDKAMRLLRTKLYDIKNREQQDRIASTRRTQVGTGDRSEKIRTYHFPQSRVTDHRIGMTLYSLPAFLSGAMDELLDALAAADTAEKLKGNQS